MLDRLLITGAMIPMPLSELHITRQWESHAIAFLAKQHLDVICVSWKNCFGLFSNA